jgi:hypothetical protein
LVRDLVVERVETHIHVVGGAAALRTAITFRNPGDGPGRAAVTLSTSLGDDRPPLLIAQRAFLADGGRATLDHRDAARTRFESFVDGLQNGVALDEARDGGREALLVSEHADGVQLPEDVGRDEPLDHTRVLPGHSALATAVSNTRGIHMALEPADSDRDDDLALHLLRPTRLDDLRLFVDGRDVSALLEGDRGGDPIDGCHGVGVSHATRCRWGTSNTVKAREILDQLARDIARVCRADIDVTVEVAESPPGGGGPGSMR